MQHILKWLTHLQTKEGKRTSHVHSFKGYGTLYLYHSKSDIAYRIIIHVNFIFLAALQYWSSQRRRPSCISRNVINPRLVTRSAVVWSSSIQVALSPQPYLLPANKVQWPQTTHGERLLHNHKLAISNYHQYQKDERPTCVSTTHTTV